MKRHPFPEKGDVVRVGEKRFAITDVNISDSDAGTMYVKWEELMPDTAQVTTTAGGSYQDALKAAQELIERRNLTGVTAIQVRAMGRTFGGEVSAWEIEVEASLS